DGRAGPAHADPAERGVLYDAEGARCADGYTALERRVSRHGIEAVQLHAHAALHDELVPEVPPSRSRAGDGGGEPLARGAAQPPQPALFDGVLLARELDPRGENGRALDVAHNAGGIVAARDREPFQLVL